MLPKNAPGMPAYYCPMCRVAVFPGRPTRKAQPPRGYCWVTCSTCESLSLAADGLAVVEKSTRRPRSLRRLARPAAPTFDQKLEGTIRAWLGNTHWSDLNLVAEWERCAVAVVQRRHRLFNVGDLVIVNFNNGEGERWPCTGYSSKLRTAVREYVLPAFRSTHWTPQRKWDLKSHSNRTTLRILELPDDGIHRGPHDPAVRDLISKAYEHAMPHVG